MTFIRRIARSITDTARLWIDSYAGDPNSKHNTAVYATPEDAARGKAESERMDFLRCIPFLLVHVVCLLVFLPGVGWSWAAVAFAATLYVVRMHAITGWYHRYFAHRTFKTSRAYQFLWAFIGNTSAQRGPLWWAAHHRHHHRHSDEDEDIHSPTKKGFWWSHMGWFTARSNFRTQSELIPDLTKYPELIWLDRFDIFAPLVLGFASFGLGWALQTWAPHLGATGWQFLIWFFISTVVTAHATFTINSLAHVFGSRRFATTDTSRNNFLLSLITLGEGWHNNHHHYQSTVRQGFRWYEVDFSWYLLVVQKWLGLVWDLKGVPAAVLNPPAAGQPPAPASQHAAREADAIAARPATPEWASTAQSANSAV